MSHYWGLWTITFHIYPEWNMKWLKYKCSILYVISYKNVTNYFTAFTTKLHKNCLHLNSLSPYAANQLYVFGHLLAWIAHRVASSNTSTNYASLASGSTGEAWWISGNDEFLQAPRSWACSDEFLWFLLLLFCFCCFVLFLPSVEGLLFLATLVASCLQEVSSPVDLLAIYLVWAIFCYPAPKS